METFLLLVLVSLALLFVVGQMAVKMQSLDSAVPTSTVNTAAAGQ